MKEARTSTFQGKEYPQSVEGAFAYASDLQKSFKQMSKAYSQGVMDKSSARDIYLAYVGVATQLSINLSLLLHLELEAHKKGKKKLELKVSKAIGSELSEWVKERERAKKQWKMALR
ncbi:MAG: hypothetical protein ABSB53_03275 [Nitrososphaerales archaeon]|jgi:hypothetical protein